MCKPERQKRLKTTRSKKACDQCACAKAKCDSEEPCQRCCAKAVTCTYTRQGYTDPYQIYRIDTRNEQVSSRTYTDGPPTDESPIISEQDVVSTGFTANLAGADRAIWPQHLNWPTTKDHFIEDSNLSQLSSTFTYRIGPDRQPPSPFQMPMELSLPASSGISGDLDSVSWFINPLEQLQTTFQQAKTPDSAKGQLIWSDSRVKRVWAENTSAFECGQRLGQQHLTRSRILHGAVRSRRSQMRCHSSPSPERRRRESSSELPDEKHHRAMSHALWKILSVPLPNPPRPYAQVYRGFPSTSSGHGPRWSPLPEWID